MSIVVFWFVAPYNLLDEDVGGTFLQNVGTTCKTTWRHNLKYHIDITLSIVRFIFRKIREPRSDS
jgi:hypothetical protein